MAMTNFGNQTNYQRTLWDAKLMATARNRSIWMNFSGPTDQDLCKDVFVFGKDPATKGLRGVITQVSDLRKGGIPGDTTLEGNEESMQQDENVLYVDQLRKAVRLEGDVADQDSIVNFRMVAANNLGYWLADTYDELAFLTLAGVSLVYNTDGSRRVVEDDDSDQPNVHKLNWASRITAPTSNRHFRWQAKVDNGRQTPGGTLAAADVTKIQPQDTLSYTAIVRLKAFAQREYIHSIMDGNGIMDAKWVLFVTPQGLSDLTLDPDFREMQQQAQPRSPDNPLFKGDDVIKVHGVYVVSHRHVWNTMNAEDLSAGVSADDGTKWGTSGAAARADSGGSATPAKGLTGYRALFCGANVLAKGRVDTLMGDRGMLIEKEFDYDNQLGIAIRAFFGFKKVSLRNRPYRETREDYVICCDFAEGQQS